MRSATSRAAAAELLRGLGRQRLLGAGEAFADGFAGWRDRGGDRVRVRRLAVLVQLHAHVAEEDAVASDPWGEAHGPARVAERAVVVAQLELGLTQAVEGGVVVG